MILRWIVKVAGPLALAAVVPAGWAQSPPPPATRVRNASGATTTVAANPATTYSLPGMAAFQTRDRLGVYSGRPVVAVGDITGVDPTSRTITVKIDRALSNLPHVLTARAKKKNVEAALLERMFPPERTFIIRRETTLMDGTRPTTATRGLTAQRERFDSLRLRLEDFHPGDLVSVRFRYYENESRPAGVLNVSKQPRERHDYEADYRMVPIVQRSRDGQSTGTTALAGATSSSLPAGALIPPNAPRSRLVTPPQ